MILGGQFGLVLGKFGSFRPWACAGRLPVFFAPSGLGLGGPSPDGASRL